MTAFIKACSICQKMALQNSGHLWDVRLKKTVFDDL